MIPPQKNTLTSILLSTTVILHGCDQSDSAPRNTAKETVQEIMINASSRKSIEEAKESSSDSQNIKQTPKPVENDLQTNDKHQIPPTTDWSNPQDLSTFLYAQTDDPIEKEVKNFPLENLLRIKETITATIIATDQQLETETSQQTINVIISYKNLLMDKKEIITDAIKHRHNEP
ncbi:hypothetical protein [Candidatus Liberibacter sp.]|uniref:hypothetical protein n=1 Tax=Candidatus Liberibacter sp. TaxID=34022 RepID=UPI0015F64FE4|nr:hypothetical protein [Candidatus Liberibacter sp.]MBA5723890.1 hypothetical protein [Candidatus Liberibacter sp.]